ncbi:MAG TPA: LTA synthase family protein [Flavobacteriales bacterium]
MIEALKPLRSPLFRLGAVLLLFTLQRVLFLVLNAPTFPAPPLAAFLGGVRFDLSAIAWLYLPFIVVSLVRPDARGTLGVVQKSTFHLSNLLCFFLNCTDLAYFNFTLKRSTADLFGIASGGNDLAHLAPVFLRDYWYVVLIFLGSMLLAEWAYRRGRSDGTIIRPWWPWRMVMVVAVVLASRGGLQYIPLSVLDAGQYAPPAYMPLVLNTPFTVMTSIGKPVLVERTFMPQEEADRRWPVVHRYGDSAVVRTPPNVVVIVLESFSAAYSGLLNGTGQGYMPFVDSLMGQGLAYTDAFANGRRSIDGLPAIIASMPKMMSEAFITSPYATTPFTSLPAVLAAKGYRTSFFHGGHNGTMGFDAFAGAAGFQRYVGRNEYPEPNDDDGVWGIRDVPFLQHFARQLDLEQQPFMSCVFTLSSHHPYHLPEAEARRFAGGTQPIHPTLLYADDALRRFFATAATKPWFRNTLFVITADHTADLERDGQESGGAFDHWIPLIYYMPGTLSPRLEHRTTQQIDILPTVLDLLGHRDPFFAFGASSLRHERPGAAISEGNATWLLVEQDLQIRSDGTEVRWTTGRGPGYTAANISDVPEQRKAEAQRTLQAAIQQFNAHLLHHELTVK